MKEMLNSYYAVIPAAVRYDNALSANAKLLYGEITALCHKKGHCFASNRYFADIYGVSTSSIQRWLKLLADRGYIALQFEKTDDKTSQTARHIYLERVQENSADNFADNSADNCENAEKNTPETPYPHSKNATPHSKNEVPPTPKMRWGYSKNATHNNTNNNTSNNIYNIYNKSSSSSLSPSPPTAYEDSARQRAEDEDFVKNEIKERIEYDILVKSLPNDKQKLDLIVDVLTSVLCSPKKEFVICGETYASKKVAEVLYATDSTLVEYTIDRLNENTKTIRNYRKYILSIVFNAANDIDAYYEAKVKQRTQVKNSVCSKPF